MATTKNSDPTILFLKLEDCKYCKELDDIKADAKAEMRRIHPNAKFAEFVVRQRGPTDFTGMCRPLAAAQPGYPVVLLIPGPIFDAYHSKTLSIVDGVNNKNGDEKLSFRSGVIGMNRKWVGDKMVAETSIKNSFSSKTAKGYGEWLAVAKADPEFLKWQNWTSGRSNSSSVTTTIALSAAAAAAAPVQMTPTPGPTLAAPVAPRATPVKTNPVPPVVTANTEDLEEIGCVRRPNYIAGRRDMK